MDNQQSNKEAAPGVGSTQGGKMKCDNISGFSLLPDGENVKGGRES